MRSRPFYVVFNKLPRNKSNSRCPETGTPVCRHGLSGQRSDTRFAVNAGAEFH